MASRTTLRAERAYIKRQRDCQWGYCDTLEVTTVEGQRRLEHRGESHRKPARLVKYSDHKRLEKPKYPSTKPVQ
ncbi:hypothetical protein Scep_004386 [Stephania cephalantha]|uniref:Uncharacterized protein n=1 Tax=Stephania cephalantha TaxID=152367 RepID=A0AAP0KSC7_9MAGN